MSAVERAARAHCRVSCDEIGQTIFCEQYGCKFWNTERRLAETRAAIASLREPTPEMLDAAGYAFMGAVRFHDPGTGDVMRPFKVWWQAAIDAALSEPRIESAAGSADGGQARKER